MRNVWIENLQYVDDCNLCVCKYVKRFQDLFETFQRRASSFEQKGLGGFGVMIRLAGDRQRILFHIEFRVVISTPPSASEELHGLPFLLIRQFYHTYSLSSCLPAKFTIAFLLLTFMND